ncbi:MAG: ADP-ribosylglycohydrolase family protein [Nanoarchaeota archaeon]
MVGAICGDIIGSVYEMINVKHTQFPLFSDKSKYTDDTVLTVAVADAIMNNRDYAEVFREYARQHPLAGYGGSFIAWVDNPNAGPYNSWGNGSAMRVSPVAWLFSDLDSVLLEAKKSADATHNHPEGVKGAQAIAAAIWMARNAYAKSEIKNYIETQFEYDLNRTIDEIRPTYEFDNSCAKTVPESIIAFLESDDYESCIRKAISIGGDSDTIAAMAGSIAEAYYNYIPQEILDGSFRVFNTIPKFTEIFNQFQKQKELKN